jgi:hypothetical protein
MDIDCLLVPKGAPTKANAMSSSTMLQASARRVLLRGRSSCQHGCFQRRRQSPGCLAERTLNYPNSCSSMQTSHRVDVDGPSTSSWDGEQQLGEVTNGPAGHSRHAC